MFDLMDWSSADIDGQGLAGDAIGAVREAGPRRAGTGHRAIPESVPGRAADLRPGRRHDLKPDAPSPGADRPPLPA